jgi:hypothetical protein
LMFLHIKVMTSSYVISWRRKSRVVERHQ